MWVSNAFANSGLEQARLFCNTAASTPNFNLFGLDPNNQPTACKNGAGATPPVPDINFFVSDFKFPQTLRGSVGFDKKLPWQMVVSGDFTASNTFKSLYINDVNLVGAWADAGVGSLAGEGNRILYGTFVGVPGTVTPTRVSTTAARYVLGLYNRGVDYSYSAVVQLQKRMSDNFEISAGYNYSRAYDLISLTSSVALSNYGFAAVDGPLGNRNLRPSYFDRPNSVKLSGLVHLPYHIDFSMTYVGVSGSPYAYVVNGDVNADGVGAGTQKNDLFYVPIDSMDISLGASTAVPYLPGTAVFTAKWDSLNNYINSEPCLASQRGKVMQRTSCRNPWLSQVNARLAWSIATYHGQRFELTADIFNVLHLINNNWGLQKLTSFNETTNIVRRTGFDAAKFRNRYDLALPVVKTVQRTDSRSRILLGGRYTF